MNNSTKTLFHVVCIVSFVCTTFLFAVCTQSPEFRPALSSRIDETDEYIEVTGLGGASADSKTTEAEAKRNAEVIAYMQAVELLAEAVQGVAVQGDITLRDLRIDEGELLQLIKVKLKNVRQVGSARFERQEDGSWLALHTIRYDKKNARSLAAEFNMSEIAGSSLGNAVSREAAMVHYSGIILDLRYIFGYASLLAPKIAATNGGELFTVRNIDPDILLLNYGIPVFSTIGEAVQFGNVGKQPLKLVPKEYISETGTIVLSERDTQRFMDSANKNELLQRGKIALIL